ncbi:MAG: Uncharacterized protein XD95_0201 [Microgenomates bacterium 39_7]|nr:MAG: Uncharacterized protein XD95_0201 [Microgenomates bacterium 39_7]
MDKTPTIYLLHIRDSINQIEEYVADYTYEQFVSDKKTQDAVIRQLEIIGEATSNLEESFKKQTSEIPWREISDFRNVLAHEYWDVDLAIVWKTVHEDVGTLKTALLSFITTS